MDKLMSSGRLRLMTSWSYANDIYVTQSGATLALDIPQLLNPKSTAFFLIISVVFVIDI